MFPLSTQKKYWVFTDEKDLIELRRQANANFVEKHGSCMTVTAFLNIKLIKFKFLARLINFI